MEIILTTLVTTLLSSCSSELYVFSDEFIEYINKRQNLWTAGKNWMPTKYVPFWKSEKSVAKSGKTRSQYDPSLPLPSHFDARKRWPHCPSIATVPDQGLCQAAWAVSAVASMTDRFCIANNATFEFSAEDLITCCESCSEVHNGCLGGEVRKAWDYWIKEGVVSGGHFGTVLGCKPYSIYLGYYMKLTNGTKREAPPCLNSCTNASYAVIYDNDKKKGGDFHMILSAYVPEIQQEIAVNGPVQAEMMLYDDFFTYRNGIYYHVSEKEVGWHSVTLIGWGEDKNVPYWLVKNTWGDSWGNFSGLFKILRGANEAYIEDYIYVGLIKKPSKQTVSSSALNIYPLMISISISFLPCS